MEHMNGPPDQKRITILLADLLTRPTDLSSCLWGCTRNRGNFGETTIQKDPKTAPNNQERRPAKIRSNTIYSTT